MVRESVQKIFGFAMWQSLSEGRRALELARRPKLSKLWEKLEKKDRKKSDAERDGDRRLRCFMRDLLESGLKTLYEIDVGEFRWRPENVTE